MSQETIRVLLIEDNPGDARLVKELLSESSEVQFEVESVTWLSDGLGRLDEGGIDLLLLDIGLPGSDGLLTLKTVRDSVAEVAVVVYTGLDSEKLALDAFRYGAQDYIVKGRFEGPDLIRALRYAYERKRAELESGARSPASPEPEPSSSGRASPENELLERLVGQFRVECPSGDSVRERMRDFVPEYSRIWEQAFADHVVEVEKAVGRQLRTLAAQLGQAGAGPCEAFELHAIVFRDRIKELPQEKRKAQIEKGRNLLLLFFGYLVHYFRDVRTD